jgi:two-component system, response regulator RegA
MSIDASSSSAAPRRVLLVDDDERFNDRLGRALRTRGIDVVCATLPAVALAQLRTEAFDGVVTDLRMPGMDGLELIKEARQFLGTARIIVLTGYGSIATAVEAMRLGANGYLVKPCNADQVLAELFGEPAVATGEDEGRDPIPSLARLEREHIERVLVECGGNVTKAAKVLGIHRRTLQYKLAKFTPDR